MPDLGSSCSWVEKSALASQYAIIIWLECPYLHTMLLDDDLFIYNALTSSLVNNAHFVIPWTQSAFGYELQNKEDRYLGPEFTLKLS